MIPLPVWDGSESTFNKLFREVRLSGKYVPGYQLARARLNQITAQGETDPEKIWQFVFSAEGVKGPKVNFVGKNNIAREDSLEASRNRHRIAAVSFRPKPFCCETCDAHARIVLDHDHKTEKLRGWICDRCNQTLGMVKDDPALLERLAKYLRDAS